MGEEEFRPYPDNHVFQKKGAQTMAKSRIVFPRIGEKEQKRQQMISYRKLMRQIASMKEAEPVAEPATEEAETK